MSRLLPMVLLSLSTALPAQAQGVFVRFQLVEPQDTSYLLHLGGYIHRDPWYLPRTVLPAGADRDKAKRYQSGAFTPWFDLKEFAGKRLHGRLNRAGGVAEFPNVTVEVRTDGKVEKLRLRIELATATDESKIVKRFEEAFTGSSTSFLVSPTLTQDAASLECASEMTARRLEWARAASKGKAVSPKQLIVQTGFWAPQRPELNLQEAEVLRLLGFNVVGNQMPEVFEKFKFKKPGHSHNVNFNPNATRADCDAVMVNIARQYKDKLQPGVPFGFSDEITCGTIGTSKQALAHFHTWLAEQKLAPADLGVKELTEVVPIETPDELRKRQATNLAATNRNFYYTSRFRQHATTERLKWLTESLHKHVGPGPLTTTLVADHPYFSGTGLGMGMGPNPAWGRAALAADWFDIARRRAVDMAGIEDWMGLQYMYGPNYTWEGFQLMGFQAAMFRSGSRGEMPIQAWITPGDEVNIRLKSASALAQGAKHFFYWTYGPTATSTENYWSDLRGAYDGIATFTRHLAEAEHIIAPGKLMKRDRIAMLYSISSDLWQPFGYVHMLERRGLYLSLVHDQQHVDFLTEEDVDAGRLKDYTVLYTADPCIKTSAAEKIASWVKAGGVIFATTAAGSRNEFNEEIPGLAEVFGIRPNVKVTVQPGRYHIRGALNALPYLDTAAATQDFQFGAIGVRISCTATDSDVFAKFTDGTPAAIFNKYGQGYARYVASCPGIAYIKEAKFVANDLKERWPKKLRAFLHRSLQLSNRRFRVSEPVVEAGVYESPKGYAIVLANFTYQYLSDVRVSIALPERVSRVQRVSSCEHNRVYHHVDAIERDGRPVLRELVLNLLLDQTDIILVEFAD